MSVTIAHGAMYAVPALKDASSAHTVAPRSRTSMLPRHTTAKAPGAGGTGIITDARVPLALGRDLIATGEIESGNGNGIEGRTLPVR